MPRKFTVGEGFAAGITGLVGAYSNYKQQQERDRQFGLKERQVAAQEITAESQAELAGAQAGKATSETKIVDIDAANKQAFWESNIDLLRKQGYTEGQRGDVLKQELAEAIQTFPERERQLLLKGQDAAIDVNLKDDTYDAVVLKTRMEAEYAEATAKVATADAADAEEMAKLKVAQQKALNRKTIADEYYTRKAGDYQAALAEHTEFDQRMAQQAIDQQQAFQVQSGMPNVGTGRLEAGSPNVLGYLDTRGADNSPVAIRGRLTKQLNDMEFFEIPEVQFALQNGRTPGGEQISEAYLQEVVLDTAQAMNTFEKSTLVDMMKAGLFIDAIRSGNKDHIKGFLPNEGKDMDHIINIFDELSEDPNFTMANIPRSVYVSSNAIDPKFHGSGFDPENLVDSVGNYQRDIELDIYAMMRAGMDYGEVVKSIGTAMDWARKDSQAKQDFQMANVFQGPAKPLAGVGTQEQRISQGRALLGGTVSPEDIGPFGVAGTAPAYVGGQLAGRDSELVPVQDYPGGPTRMERQSSTSFQREFRAARGPSVNLTSFGSLMRAAGARARANARFPFKKPSRAYRPSDRARP
jgi:hypothetical protein